MGTEIIKIDASWAEKLTITRVSFLMTPTVDRLLRGVWISAQVVLLVCWIVCSREIVKIKGDPAQQQWAWVEMSPAQWSIDPAVLLPARYL